MKRLATSLGIVLALSGPAWAEWVLWSKKDFGTWSGGRWQPVDVFASRSGCHVAAQRRVQAWADDLRAFRTREGNGKYGKADDIVIKGLAVVDVESQKIRQRDDALFSVACWPVGVNPQ